MVLLSCLLILKISTCAEGGGMKKSALAVSVLSFRYVTRFSFYKKIIAVMFVVRVRPVYVVSCVGV